VEAGGRGRLRGRDPESGGRRDARSAAAARRGAGRDPAGARGDDREARPAARLDARAGTARSRPRAARAPRLRRAPRVALSRASGGVRRALELDPTAGTADRRRVRLRLLKPCVTSSVHGLAGSGTSVGDPDFRTTLATRSGAILGPDFRPRRVDLHAMEVAWLL